MAEVESFRGDAGPARPDEAAEFNPWPNVKSPADVKHTIRPAPAMFGARPAMQCGTDGGQRFEWHEGDWRCQVCGEPPVGPLNITALLDERDALLARLASSPERPVVPSEDTTCTCACGHAKDAHHEGRGSCRVCYNTKHQWSECCPGFVPARAIPREDAK